MHALRTLVFGSIVSAPFVISSCGSFSGESTQSPGNGTDATAPTADVIATATVNESSVPPIVQLDSAFAELDGTSPADCPVQEKFRLCDNFDDPKGVFASFWTTPISPGNAPAISTLQFISPPSSLLTQQAIGASAGVSALAGTIDFQPHVTVDVDFFVTIMSTAGEYVDIVDIAFDSDVLQTARIAIGVAETKADIEEWDVDATNPHVTSGLPTMGVALGAWHHAHAAFFFSHTNGSVEFELDGSSFGQNPASATIPSTTPTTLTVHIGDSPSGVAASTVYLDNFVMTSAP